MSADHDFGDAVDAFVQAHFKASGYELGYLKRDNGIDFLVRLGGGPWLGAQVKHLKPSGVVNLRAPSRGRAAKREENRAAANNKRPYDLLIIACEDRMWVIPEDATRGITSLTLRDARSRKWRVNSKWNQYLVERKVWAKHASVA